MNNSPVSEHISFTPMTLEMLPSILVIENQAYPIPWSVQTFKDCITKDYVCKLMLLKGQVIGYHIVQVILDEYHILNICVSKDYQGKGFGKYQLQAIKDKAESELMNRILLEVRASNKIAKNLYLKSGFQQIGKRKNYYPISDGREDAFVLELALG
ncbi:MAG: ribosomal-protein-alanine N-acetyltransferase [Enterobacterales bacterium]|jgi:ribosomal-protein-alanine N-acetyltransferase